MAGASDDLGGTPADPAAVQPVPPVNIDAGSSHNSGIAQEWQPGLAQTVVDAVAAQSQVPAMVASYQAQSAAFIAEHAAQVLGGHTPVGLAAANQPGPADIGGPSNPGQTDG